MDCAVGDTDTFSVPTYSRVSMETTRGLSRLRTAFEEVRITDALEQRRVAMVHEADDDEDDGEDTAILVADGIPLESWNRFAMLKKLPLGLQLRQLVWDDGNVWIVEFTISPPHEAAADECSRNFMILRRYGGGLGHMTLEYPHQPTYSADYTFRPRHNLPGIQIPRNIAYGDWVMVIVEVLHSQQWGQVHRKVAVYRQRPGVEYILCVKMSNQLHHWSYELYDVRNNQPPPDIFYTEANRQAFYLGTVGNDVHVVSLETRRVLGLQQGAPLPQDCPATIDIDVVEMARQVSSLM
ncbi:hypothetical protein PHYBOEH_001816 [Phytophthora boehmeriae]|uniref:Uncharacterized protein n=1 Tax=Phytophthora boehmeriae TaxID=109152 RepID=A0A8T1V4A3_9STRA|nr:hypothetical protein PHYBOEH_001816 [Phytophthora boehmeriae]